MRAHAAQSSREHQIIEPVKQRRVDTRLQRQHEGGLYRSPNPEASSPCQVSERAIRPPAIRALGVFVAPIA